MNTTQLNQQQTEIKNAVSEKMKSHKYSDAEISAIQ